METADLVTCTEEILYGKLHFLGSVTNNHASFHLEWEKKGKTLKSVKILWPGL